MMMADDASVDSSSLMDLGMTTTGSSLTEGKDGQELGVQSIRMVATPTSMKRMSSAPAGEGELIDDIDDEEELKFREPERRSHVGSLSNFIGRTHITNSKIEWGQDAVLSPSKSRLSATQLAGMVMKQKAEEVQQLNELESRLENPRPLTGSMTGRLDTPNVTFDRMTDSPSPDKMGRMDVDMRLINKTGDTEALPLSVEDRADQIFDIAGSEDEEGEGVEGVAAQHDGSGAVLNVSAEIGDYLSIEEMEREEEDKSGRNDIVDSSLVATQNIHPRDLSPSDSKGGSTESPEVGIISDNGVVVDTRPIVKHHGKTGHFTEGVLQPFPLFSGEGPRSPGASSTLGGSSSGVIQPSKSVDALLSESVGSLSAVSGFGSVLGSNIIKPIRGSSLTTSATTDANQSSVNVLLERFVEKEKVNRERELVLSLKQGEDRGYVQGLALEASSIIPGLGSAGFATSGNTDAGSVGTGGTRGSLKSGGGGSAKSVDKDNADSSLADSTMGSSIEIDFHLPALPAGASADVGQLSDRSSLNSTSQTTTDENPLRRITLQPEASVNQLYDSSQREALAMFYLNEQGSKTSLNDDDSLSSTGAEGGLIPYRVHNRIMGWKLTTPQKRRQLLGMLDSVHELNRPLGAEGSYASGGKMPHLHQAPTMRQAQAWGDAVNRMHRARDRTPQGQFKKLMKEKAERSGQVQRGSGRPGSVQSHLIAETDKAGLHRAIRDGLSAMESEVFLEQVREKSRERSRQKSRQRSSGGNRVHVAEGDDVANSNADSRRIKAKQKAVAAGREGLGSRGFVEGPVTSWDD